MGSAALAAATAVAAVAALLLAILLTTRAVRVRRRAVAAELARARADVDALGARVAELASELVETRRTAAADHEYVITSLTGAGPGSGSESGTADRADVERSRRRVLEAQLVAPGRVPLGRRLEDRVLETVSRRDRPPGPLVELAVRTLALGHGVRRALTPDNLDRAAAESQVARRRSRRNRRRELRDARRLIRDGAGASPVAPSAAASKAQDVA